MEPRITLITLGVSDLDRSVRFDRDGLGLPQRNGPAGIAFHTAYLDMKERLKTE